MLAFHDINPSAPVHVLCVPKIHIDSLNDVNSENIENIKNIEYVSHIMEKIAGIAKSLGVDKGYRVVTNIGKDGGQSVSHLHFHILGGKKLRYMC